MVVMILSAFACSTRTALVLLLLVLFLLLLASLGVRCQLSQLHFFIKTFFNMVFPYFSRSLSSFGNLIVALMSTHSFDKHKDGAKGSLFLEHSEDTYCKM